MSAPERPLIAINGLLLPGESPALKLANRYANAVLKAGGLPLAIPPLGGPLDVERLVARVDGLLLTGGDDFDMERLGLGPTHPTAEKTPAEKQDFDFVLARAAIASRTPVLGICYGMQLLGLAEEGRMYQHLPEDRPGCQEHRKGAIHSVRVEPNTRLARLLAQDEVNVISRHHQALAAIGPRWKVSARDGEGLIEAIERDDHPFAVAVQWHPELAEEGSVQDRLFRGLVHAAAIAATQRFLAAR